MTTLSLTQEELVRRSAELVVLRRGIGAAGAGWETVASAEAGFARTWPIG